MVDVSGEGLIASFWVYSIGGRHDTLNGGVNRVDLRMPCSKVTTVFIGDMVAINARRNHISRRGRDIPECCVSDFDR